MRLSSQHDFLLLKSLWHQEIQGLFAIQFRQLDASGLNLHLIVQLAALQ